MNTPIENPPTMTAEQIAKLRELEAKARTPMTQDMSLDELRGIEIARMNFRGLANQHAIPLCNALEAAQTVLRSFVKAHSEQDGMAISLAAKDARELLGSELKGGAL